jgi:Ca2+-binding RTX toxin-like protein
MTLGPVRVAAVAVAVAIIALLALAFSATNTVPASNAGRDQRTIGAQDIAPPQCAGMGLTAVVTNLNGGNANELVLGTAAGETLNGNNGNDCLVGGGGDDTLRGGAGTDVCIGGGGANETYNQSETQDP